MPDSTQQKYRLQRCHPELRVTPEDYTPFMGEQRVESLKSLARPLQGTRWAHVNSTMNGGGVAELLRSVIPLASSLGLDAQWHVISGSDAFFEVTKKFHNLLQGVSQPISLHDLFSTYLDTISANGTSASIESDFIVVHDPRPLGLVNSGVLLGNVLWRCHIDTSSRDPVVWRFLVSYINQCAGAIFTMPQFVGAGVHIPQYEISPCIDPLTVKNHQYSQEEALTILSPLCEASNVDAERPLSLEVALYIERSLAQCGRRQGVAFHVTPPFASQFDPEADAPWVG